MNATIEQLHDHQWRELRDLRLAALADSPLAFWSTWAQEADFDEQRWTAFLHAATWFVARHEGRTIGGVGALLRPELADEPEMIGMWVAPTFRRNGVATSLLAACCYWAFEQHHRAVTLWVVDSNEPARRLYEKFGFGDTGERARHPNDPDSVEIRMRRPTAGARYARSANSRSTASQA